MPQVAVCHLEPGGWGVVESPCHVLVVNWQCRVSSCSMILKVFSSPTVTGWLMPTRAERPGRLQAALEQVPSCGAGWVCAAEGAG